jgi:hypothetical protein
MAEPQAIDELAQAHIAAEARLRLAVAGAALAIWTQLPSYDRPDVPNFLRVLLPILEAGKRQSVALTRAYLARATDRPVAPIDVPQVLAGLRNGTPPEVVYERPFIQTWTDLKAGKPFEDAVRSAGARVESSAATDIQLAMTHTLRAVGEADDTILGFRRVPDPGACPFCVLIAGRRYLTSDLQPVHARCGCSVAPITAANRGDFIGKRENDLALPAGVAVGEHGELGPVLHDPAHSFLSLAA